MPRKRKLDSTKVNEEKEENATGTRRKKMKLEKEEKKSGGTEGTRTRGRGKQEKEEKPEKGKCGRTRKKAEEDDGMEKRKERKATVAKKPVTPPPESSESESEWEDVADHPDTSASTSGTTGGSIQITVNAPKTQKEIDLEAEMRRAIKRFRKEFQENLHKAHLLSFIGHGRQLSMVCNDQMNQAMALSMVPVGYSSLGKDVQSGKAQIKQIFQSFVKWFRSGFAVVPENVEDMSGDLVLDIRRCLINRTSADIKMLTMCFVTTVRSLRLDCRLVFNAHPISRKMENDTSNGENGNKKAANGADGRSNKSKLEKTVNGGSSLSNSSKRGTRGNSGQGRSKPSPIANGQKERKRDSASCMKNESSKSSGNVSEAGACAKTDSDCEYWAEVYLENMEQWICVDCGKGVLDDVETMRTALTAPVIYCLGFDKDLALKDVTGRYSLDFMSTQTRRLRADPDWLSKTCALFKSTKRMRNRLEDMQLEAQFAKQKLPTSLGDYKNHPLYVLKKDLKKFEGLYPADTKPTGYIRNEPIYPRSAVHDLHSKDQWRKEALMVKENEEPFKIVKGRPKWKAANQEKGEDREVPLYGKWQTEPYKPKAAKDGMVPRNEYGNVELFQMSMLPPGTVYMELPGLLTVAKKMDIDCAPAMIGWEFHGRGSHPVLNGWVVCEEYKDVLTAAWEEEQEIVRQRQIERRSQRALQNWRRLLKSLMIRQKLQQKFNPTLNDRSTSDHDDSRKKSEADEETNLDSTASTSNDDATALNKLAWPQCRHEFTGNQHEEL